MKNFEYPKTFARFYDQIYHYHRDDVDNAWFQEQIKRTKGRVLEVGCGTGRLLMNALNAGADIYGIDISGSMLDILKTKLPKNQHRRISRQNIIDFTSDFKFDLVIAPFRVMMHLQTKEEQLMALNNVYDHLHRHGRFIFDTFIPDLNYLIKGYDNFTDYEGEYEPGKKVRRIVTSHPDLISQTITVNFRIEWEEGNELKKEEWVTPMRFFFRYELEHLIERSLFRKYKILGDYKGNELGSNSKEFIVICEK
jgi:SAM-dependent methyltransferase